MSPSWLSCLVVGVPEVRAQSAATGSIEGLVTDSTGGVLPGATVIVRNMDTNVPRDVVADGDGRYRATALPPGRYEVAVTLTGFQAAPLSNITVQVGQTVPIDVRMRPAGVDETINVIADAPLLDIQRTNVSNVFGQDVIQNLPLNGRRWDQFVMLGPGVTNDGTFGLISYRGISGLYNNNMVDGVDNNQAFFSEARGRTRAVYSISESAIKEFQVGVSNMSAEFGRAAGGTVNAVTKSGSNAFSGETFYFLRDKSIPVAGSVHHRCDLGHAAGAPPAVRDGLRRSDQEEQGVLLRRLRSAAAHVSAVHQHVERNVLQRRLHDFGGQLRGDDRFLSLARGDEPARSEQQGGAGPHRLGDQSGQQLLDQLQRPALELAQRHQYRRGADPGEFRRTAPTSSRPTSRSST